MRGRGNCCCCGSFRKADGIVDDPEELVSAGRKGLGRLRSPRAQGNVVGRDQQEKKFPANDGHTAPEQQPMHPLDLEIDEHMGQWG